MEDEKLIDDLLAQGFSDEEIVEAMAAAGPAAAPAAPVVTEKPAVPQREIAVNTTTGGEFNGILDNPIARGLGTALDFVGGVARTGAANLADPLFDREIATKQDFIDAINPFDNKDAIGSDELIRRATGVERQDGLQAESDLGGFVLDAALDPLSYLSLGTIPAIKGIAKVANVVDKVNSSGGALRKSLTAPLEAVTRLSGRILTTKGGDVVDNFISDPIKFMKAAGDDVGVTEIYKNVIDKVDVANQAVRNQLSQKFEDVLEGSTKLVDISKQKADLEALKSKFPVAKARTDAQLATAKKIEEITDSLLGKKVDGLPTAGGPDGLVNQSFSTIPDQLPARDADAFLKSFDEFRTVGKESSVAEKRAAKAVNDTAKELSERLFGKKLSKEYKEKVIDRGQETKALFGESFNLTPAQRAIKAQTTLKSATRSDNFALKNLINNISKDTGQDILKDGLDVRTLDLASSSVGRLVSGGLSGASAGAGELGFKGLAVGNKLLDSAVNNPFSAAGIDNLTRRALTGALQGDGN